ncbi:MAG: tetratricopeptide repeat protein [Cyanobacteria bacterium P01_H01_bin.15]
MPSFAIASYDKTIEIKPNFHEAWNNRGCSLEKRGRSEKANCLYQKALSIKPNEQLYLNNLTNLGHQMSHRATSPFLIWPPSNFDRH